MNTNTSPSFLSVLRLSSGFALQWRLLLLWVLVMLIPTAVMALPLWSVLGMQIDHSVISSEIAQRLDVNSFYDVMGVMTLNQAALKTVGLVAVILTLLLSPFLTAAVLTAARAREALSIGKLVHGATTEYWRMFRMMIWSLIPLGIAMGIGSGLTHWSDSYAEKAILETDADFVSHIAMVVMAILFLIGDATVDAGRAQIINNSTRRSVIKAWWSGTKLVFKRPLTVFGSYLILTIIGLILAAIFAVIRLNIGQISTSGFVVALLVTQLIVVSFGWVKIARIHALAQLAK